MSSRKNILVTFGFVLSVGLVAAAVSVLLASYHYSRLQFELLNGICSEVVEEEPETKIIISAALKEYTGGNPDGVAEEDVLSALGYRISDFSGATSRQNILLAATGFLTGSLLFIVTFLYRNKREAIRIRNLAEYLEQVNIGDARCFLQKEEDEFSKLQDELYKTVTELYQTREKALLAKNRFAENLYNIAHQMKTPLTAISLSVQTVDNRPQEEFAEQIRRQVLRLTCLEEALLLLSRIDAGTLLLERRETDVFTLLSLAADNLQELSQEADVFIDVPEAGAVTVCVDLEWTMEAVMNLMKNCMEHTKRGGTVFVSYEQNHLYTQVRIWDEGAGFAKEDLTHLFERFYRGQNEKGGGIGIGLAISKELIESQNGTVTAKNLPDGGACFEIRFYCH